MSRRIAHLDLDAFYASVELLRNPALRGKPVIVSGSGPRAVVTTATYEARAFGVGSAMPTSRALRLCPGAILIPPDFPAYRAASERVWEIVGAHVEVVERAGLDEGYLDVSEAIAPAALLRRLVATIREATGLGASIGIGPNRLVAKVASDCEKPEGFVILSRDMACERFAGAPPGLLPGIGPKTAERLERMGIATLAQLRAQPPERLQATFGEGQGLFLHRRAHFEDDTPLTTVREAKSQSSETTFDTDVADRDSQEEVIDELARSLCERLRKRELRGRTIGIKVRLDDWTTVTRARTVDRPTNDPVQVSSIARELLRAYDPPRPVRLLGVRLAAFEAPESAATAPAADESQLQLAV